MKLLLYVFREGKKLIVTQVVEQWAMIPKASVRIPPEDQHFFFFFSSEKNSSEIRQQLESVQILSSCFKINQLKMNL